MKGSELKKIRKAFGMSKQEFAIFIGYTGTPKNNDGRLLRYENDKVQIPLYLARLIWLLDQLRRVRMANHELYDVLTPEGVPRWPEWPGYEFESIPDDPPLKRGNDERDDFY